MTLLYLALLAPKLAICTHVGDIVYMECYLESFSVSSFKNAKGDFVYIESKVESHCSWPTGWLGCGSIIININN